MLAAARRPGSPATRLAWTLLGALLLIGLLLVLRPAEAGAAATAPAKAPSAQQVKRCKAVLAKPRSSAKAKKTCRAVLRRAAAARAARAKV
nr:hypothetical protein [Acidimicrobiia bacterium]